MAAVEARRGDRLECTRVSRVALLSLVLVGAARAHAQPLPVPDADPIFDADREELHPVEESPRDLHWGRMLAEAGLLVVALEIPYWLDKEANSFDFQYVADWRNFKERFITLGAWSLDDNYFNTNGWRHTAQGGLNYLFARSNGFSSIQSYVVSLTASAAWEFFGEYREEVSINDLIMTPRSGAVVGETVWQLGTFFLRGDRNPVNQVLGNALTGGRGILDWFDGKPAYHARDTSRLGFDTSLLHRFEASFVGGVQRESSAHKGVFRFGLETEVISIPGFDRPGRTRELRTAPSFTQIRVEATHDDEQYIDFRAFARAAVTMWHRKNIDAHGDGWNLLYGLSSAYEYGFHATEERSDPHTRDRVALTHLLGPTVDLTMYDSDLRARVVFDVYADWGLVRSAAMDAHLALFPDEQVRSTISRDNYYHALGLTGRAHLEIAYRELGAGLEYQIDELRSVQGIDRHQADIIEDYTLYDAREEGRLWGRYHVGLGRDLRLEVELSAELRDRSGQVKSTARSEHERRYLAGIQLVF